MRLRGSLGKRLPVLIEVKLSPEETKGGVEPDSTEASQLLERLPGFSHLETCGSDDDCAVGRGGGCDTGLLSQLARVAGSMGGGASAIKSGCVVDGDERRFCAGD